MALKRKSLIIWLTILELPFIYLSYQYLVTNSLAVYDASSHLGAVWYLKNYLWPLPYGWNSFNLVGYVQGLSYPPFFHYLAATVSFLVNIDLATKFLIIAALIVLPLSVYLFTTNFLKAEKGRVFTTGALLLLIFVIPGYFGADVKALFQVGLLPSFFSLPLVFLFLWLIFRQKQNWIINSLLLSSIILTHLVAGILGLLVLLSLIAARFIKKQPLKEIWLSVGLVILLTSFFLVPFVINYNLLSQSVHLGSLLLANAAILVVGILSASYFYRKNRTKLLSLALVSSLIATILVLDSLSARFFADNFVSAKLYSLHLYRYQIYLYLIAAFLIIFFPARFLFETLKKPRIKPEITTSLPILLLLVLAIWKSPVIVNQAEIQIKNKSQDGRFIETFSREDAYPLVYASQNKVVQDLSRAWGYGLFTDGTPNGPYLSSLVRSFDPTAVDDPKEKFIERRKLDRAKHFPMLDHFGISNLLFTDPKEAPTEKKLDTLLLPSTSSNLVAIPNLELTKVTKDWPKEVEKWWLSSGKVKDILVFDPDNSAKLPEKKTQATVSNLSYNQDWTKFSFLVNSSEVVPVLVKFTNFPGWTAKSSGEKLQIYQASPYLMLIFAKGKVDFSYQMLWYQKLTLVVSLVTLLLTFYVLIRKSFFRG